MDEPTRNEIPPSPRPARWKLPALLLGLAVVAFSALGRLPSTQPGNGAATPPLVQPGAAAGKSSPAASSNPAGPSAASGKEQLIAPTVSLKALNGDDATLNFKGKVRLVNFWATWCGPCRAEIPDLIGLQKKYGSRGFEVVGISVDEGGQPTVAPFVKENAMNYPVYLDEEGAASRAFGGVNALPTSILLDTNGRLVDGMQGMVNVSAMGEQIEKLLRS